jgi:hypothetical protein
VRSSKIVEEARGVIQVGGSHGDVHDAARAVECLLESVQSRVFNHNLHTPVNKLAMRTCTVLCLRKQRDHTHLLEVTCVELEDGLVVHDAAEEHVPNPAQTLREHVLEAHLGRR